LSRRKPRGFYTDERGRVRPIMGSGRGRKKTIFFPPRYKKYADIVSLRTPEEAEAAVKLLTEEFEKAETLAKKLRILRVINLAANRAMVARKRAGLSPEEKHELWEIEKIYRVAYEELREKYMEEKYGSKPKPSRRRKRRTWTEMGRGSKGSIFISNDDIQVRAVREGRTVGGLQIWRLIKEYPFPRQEKVVHLKNRRELKEAIQRNFG